MKQQLVWPIINSLTSNNPNVAPELRALHGSRVRNFVLRPRPIVEKSSRYDEPPVAVSFAFPSE